MSDLGISSIASRIIFSEHESVLQTLSTRTQDSPLRFLLCSEPSIHSAGLLSEYILERKLDVDYILCIGFAFDKVDQEFDDNWEQCFHLFSNTHAQNERLDSLPDIVQQAQAEGKITSIISQLENIGQVIYLLGPHDKQFFRTAKELTVCSKDSHEQLVNIAPSLSVAGFNVFNDDVDSVDRASLFFKNAAVAANESNQSLIFMESQRSDVVFHMSAIARDADSVSVRSEERPTSFHLLPLWKTGCFFVIDVSSELYGEMHSSDNGVTQKKTWRVSRAEQFNLDFERHRLLPVET